MVHQLTRCLREDEICDSAFAPYFTDHTLGVAPQAAAGMPFTASAMAVKGDPITDLHEDLAAEQKARTTYENLLHLADDPDVKDVLRFLRAREIVHYQRFAEGLTIIQDKLDDRNFYAFNCALHNCMRDRDCDRARPCEQAHCRENERRGERSNDCRRDRDDN